MINWLRSVARQRSETCLLLEPELTLQNVITIAKQVGYATQSAHEQHNMSAVQEDKQEKRYTQRCYRCHPSQHFANSITCPAKNKTCRKCNRKGHFVAVWRSHPSMNAVKQVEQQVLATNHDTEHAIFCEMVVSRKRIVFGGPHFLSSCLRRFRKRLMTLSCFSWMCRCSATRRNESQQAVFLKQALVLEEER